MKKKKKISCKNCEKFRECKIVVAKGKVFHCIKWEKEKLQEIGDSLERHFNENLSSSGFDGTWTAFSRKASNKYPISLCGEYHCMDEMGGYDGWVYFRILFTLEDLKEKTFSRLCFFYPESQRKAKKYYLREYLEDCIQECLEGWKQPSDLLDL